MLTEISNSKGAMRSIRVFAPLKIRHALEIIMLEPIALSQIALKPISQIFAYECLP